MSLSDSSDDPASRPLAAALVTLAGTPDDASTIDAQLDAIAQLAADRVAVVSYASITGARGGEYTTVAATSELAEAVDEAQYADSAGPCIAALDEGAPVTVPQIATTMRWPKFREQAIELGLCASVSLPLYVGTSAPVAVLNMYGHDHDAMAPLIAGVWSVYDPARPLPPDSANLPGPDPGANELIEGFAEVLAVRATIQLALSLIIAGERCNNADAYLFLRLRAAEAGTDLTSAAAKIIAHTA